MVGEPGLALRVSLPNSPRSGLPNGTDVVRHAICSDGALQRQSACMHGSTSLPRMSNPGASHRGHDRWIGCTLSRLDIQAPSWGRLVRGERYAAPRAPWLISGERWRLGRPCRDDGASRRETELDLPQAQVQVEGFGPNFETSLVRIASLPEPVLRRPKGAR